MIRPIDPKYGVRVFRPIMRALLRHTGALPLRVDEQLTVQLVKLSTDEPIPDDEPLILFRARDKFALDLLKKYRAMCMADGCTAEHMAGIDNRIEAFHSFQESHPERMKQPGITRGM